MVSNVMTSESDLLTCDTTYWQVFTRTCDQRRKRSKRIFCTSQQKRCDKTTVYLVSWPGAVARSEASSLGMQAAPSSIPTSGTFFRGDLFMKIFLRPFSLFRWFKKSSCQLLAKECALSTGKLPRRLAQEQCGLVNWPRPKWPKMCRRAVKQKSNQTKPNLVSWRHRHRYTSDRAGFKIYSLLASIFETEKGSKFSLGLTRP